jgi:hypothetical protein
MKAIRMLVSQNAGQLKEIARGQNHKSSISKSADPGSKQNPEQTAKQQAKA